MDNSPRDEDLARRVAALEEAMRELQAELREDEGVEPVGAAESRASKDLIRFADEAAIPAMIFVLKANIRVLEGVRRGLRMAEAEPGDAEEMAAVGERTVEQFDELLEELQELLEGIPEHPEARAVLEEGRELRAELDERLRAAREDIDGPSTQVAEAMDAELEALDEMIDVEAELEAIKREHEGAGGADDGDDASQSDPGKSD